MVFPFIPILTAAIGVAGSVAQMSAQQAQVSANNRAIDNQISSNERLETIRRSQVKVQQTVLNRQLAIDRMTRRQQYSQELNNIAAAELQERRSRQAELAGINLTQEQFRGQIQQGRNKSTGGYGETQNSLYSQRAQVSNQNAQQLGEVGNQLRGVEFDRNGNANLLSQLAVAGVSRGRSSQVLQSDPMEQLLPAVTALAQSQGQAQVSTEQSEALLKFIDGISKTQLMFEQQELSRAEMESNRNAESARRIRELMGNNVNAQLGNSRGLARGSFRIDNANLGLNNLIAQGNLITGSQLQSAQAAMANSQLAAQRQVGASPLSQIAAIGGALSPLMSLISSGTRPAQAAQPQQQYGVMQSPALSVLSSTPRYNQIQNVIGNSYG